MFRIGDLAFIYGVWCWHAHSRVGLYAACISVVTWGRSVPDFYPSKSLVSGVRVIEWSVTTVQLVVWMLCAYQDNTCLDVVCHHITSPVLDQPTVDATFLHLSHTARNVVTVCLENRTGCRRDIFNAINTFTLFRCQRPGAMSVRESSSVELAGNNDFSHNSASGDGGGVLDI